MTVEVIMPHMGESVVEGTIVTWLKKPGDAVAADEPLVEVATEKVDVEIPAIAAGVLLRILTEEGATVRVGQPIAIIGEPDEEIEQPQPAPREAGVEVEQAAPPQPEKARPAAKGPAARAAPLLQEAAEMPPAPEPPARPRSNIAPTSGPVEIGALGVLASPGVRRLARQRGIDLAAVTGTGRLGRITREDVQAHVAGKETAEQEESAAPEPQPSHPGVDEEIVPLTPMRRAIAEHMVRSRRDAPHVTTVAEVDMTAVADLRKRHKAAFAERGTRLTYMAFILDAVARALHDYPELNASWTDKGILLKYRIGLGIAVAVEGGLVVPVIRDADRMSIAELAAAVESIAAKTRAGKVAPGDLRGGTFTITNPGVFGAVISTPIIHQPQAAILATGRIADVPAVVKGGIAVRKRMFLSLSYDHRVVDGATAARFLQKVRELLEAADFRMG